MQSPGSNHQAMISISQLSVENDAQFTTLQDAGAQSREQSDRKSLLRVKVKESGELKTSFSLIPPIV